MPENVAELSIRLLDDLSAPARLMSASLKGITADVARANATFETLHKRVEIATESAKKGLEHAAIAAGAFAAALYKPIEGAMEFTESLKDIQLGTRASDEAIEELGDSFTELASKIGVHASDIAKAVGKMPEKFRENHEELLRLTETVGRFATATRSDFGASLQLVTPLMANLGIQLEDLDTAFDQLTQTELKTKIPAQDLAEIFPRLTEQMKGLGVGGTKGLGDILTFLNALTLKTQDAAKSGSIFKRVIDQLLRPQFYEKTGIPIAEIMKKAIGEGRSPIEAALRALKQFTQDWAKASGKSELAVLEHFFGRFSTDIFAAIDALDKFPEATKDVFGSAGATMEAFKKRQDDWTFGWKQLSIAVENFSLSLGRLLGPALAPYVDYLTRGVQWLEAFDKAHGGVIVNLVKLGAVLIGVSAAINLARLAWFLSIGTLLKLAGGIEGVTAALGFLTVAFESNPIGWVITIGAAIIVWAKWKDIINFTADAIERVQRGIERFQDLFSHGRDSGLWQYFFGGGVQKQAFRGSAAGAGGLYTPISFGGGLGSGAVTEGYQRGVLWRLDRIIELFRFTQSIMGAGFSGIPGWKYQGPAAGGGGGGGGFAGGGTTGRRNVSFGGSAGSFSGSTGGAAAGNIGPLPGGDVGRILATIRQRESRGNYQEHSGSSTASGAYQFTNDTWRGLTKKFGIGTQYATAAAAPSSVQDEIAKLYVSDILKRHGGDVSWVPREWYAGPKGFLTPHELQVNRGQTVEAYQRRWLADYAKQGGGAVSGGGHIRGTLAMGGETFQYGSGGHGGLPHIPFGNYPITPGTIGAWGRAHGAIGINNNQIWDPALGRMRAGIEFHAGSDDNLLSAGCMAILSGQWPQFKKKLNNVMKQHGHAFLHVGPRGASITPNREEEPSSSRNAGLRRPHVSHLASSLQRLGSSSVAPHVDDRHIDDAIHKVRHLHSLLRATERHGAHRGAQLTHDDGARHHLDNRYQSSRQQGT